MAHKINEYTARSCYKYTVWQVIRSRYFQFIFLWNHLQELVNWEKPWNERIYLFIETVTAKKRNIPEVVFFWIINVVLYFPRYTRKLSLFSAPFPTFHDFVSLHLGENIILLHSKKIDQRTEGFFKISLLGLFIYCLIVGIAFLNPFFKSFPNILMVETMVTNHTIENCPQKDFMKKESRMPVLLVRLKKRNERN